MAQYGALASLYGDLGANPADNIKTLKDLCSKTGKIKQAIGKRDYQSFAIHMSDILQVQKSAVVDQ